MITSDVENYPGYPDGVMGPEMMDDFRRQAERFGAEFITDDVTKVDFSERPFRIWVERDEYRANAVIVATGASARWLGLESETAAAGPRRLGLRHLRRRVLQGEADRRRRRRRHRVRGGAVPDALRHEGDARPPARRVPRLADHGRPGPGERQNRAAHAIHRRRGARRRRASPACGCATPRPARPREIDARRASSSRSATTRTRSSSSTSSTTTRTATWSPSPARPRRTSPASSPSATSRITSTARRSRRPAPGCMGALDAERYLAALEGRYGAGAR